MNTLIKSVSLAALVSLYSCSSSQKMHHTAHSKDKIEYQCLYSSVKRKDREEMISFGERFCERYGHGNYGLNLAKNKEGHLREEARCGDKEVRAIFCSDKKIDGKRNVALMFRNGKYLTNFSVE